MLYYILISIVFLAELIIAGTIVNHLMRLGELFRKYSSCIEDSRENIKSLVESCTKISEQLLELAPIFVKKIQRKIIELVLNNIKATLIGTLFWAVKQSIKRN